MPNQFAAGQTTRVNAQQGARQTARQREQAQSVPRPSRIRMAVKVRGAGETRLPVIFGAYLLDEPTVSFGCVAEVPLKFGELPLATCTVLAWNKSKGMYQGALLGLRVESNKFDIVVNFSLTFEASALRSQSLG